jgi:hypothetical protein
MQPLLLHPSFHGCCSLTIPRLRVGGRQRTQWLIPAKLVSWPEAIWPPANSSITPPDTQVNRLSVCLNTILALFRSFPGERRAWAPQAHRIPLAERPNPCSTPTIQMRAWQGKLEAGTGKRQWGARDITSPDGSGFPKTEEVCAWKVRFGTRSI